MRKYQRIWDKIKLDVNSSVTIAADSTLHKRIVDCVRKEKNMDLGWKLLMQEQDLKYELHYKLDESDNLVFFLVPKPIITVNSL